MKEKHVINSLSDIMEQETQFPRLSRIFRLAKTVKKQRKMTNSSKDVRMKRALEFMAKLQSTENKLRNGER